MVMLQERLRDGIAHAIGVVLVDVFAVGQPGDRPPIGHLERARGGAVIGQRWDDRCPLPRRCFGMQRRMRPAALTRRPLSRLRRGEDVDPLPQFLGQLASGLAMIGRGLHVPKPIFQRFLLRDLQHRTGETGRQTVGWPHSSAGVEHFAGIVDGHVALVVLRRRRETVQCRHVLAAGQQPRPQLDRPGRIRPSRPRRRSNSPAGRATQPRPPTIWPPGRPPAADANRPRAARPASPGKESDSRIVRLRAAPPRPARAPCDRHEGRPAGGGNRASRSGRCGPSACRTAPVVGGRAEQHVRHAVFAVGHAQFILVPVDLGPAVRAAIGVSQRQPARIGLGMVGMRLVHPARLRHAHTVRLLVPREHVQQRNLHGQGQLFAQAEVRRRAPKHQAARETEADAARRRDRPGESAPDRLPKGRNVSRYRTPRSRSLVGQQIRLRPGGQLILLRRRASSGRPGPGRMRNPALCRSCSRSGDWP